MTDAANNLLKNRFIVDDIQYSFAGHRLMFLKSSADDIETWQDVPEHFGRFYPCTIELPSVKISLLGEGVWFSGQLEQILNSQPVEYKIESRLPSAGASGLMFVNCLDPVFGHALYKLSAARELVSKFPEKKVVVLVTKNMLSYASFSGFYIAINESPSKLLQPSTNLAVYFKELLNHYLNVNWAFCNGSRTGDQQSLPGEIIFQSQPGLFLTFIHRNDRCWGITPGMQVRRVNKVFSAIKKLNPQIKTAVIGVEQRHLHYKADLNLLYRKHSPEFEKDLADLAHKSVCIFGVHGSNILVPSYYAQTTVELLPYSRLGNYSQAYWPNPRKSAIETVFSFRVLYGDRFLLNVFPQRVIWLIDHLIKRFPQFQLRADDSILLHPCASKIEC